MLSFTAFRKSRSKKFGSRAPLSKLFLSLGAVVLHAQSVQGASDPSQQSVLDASLMYLGSNKQNKPTVVVIKNVPYIRIMDPDLQKANSVAKSYILCRFDLRPVTMMTAKTTLRQFNEKQLAKQTKGKFSWGKPANFNRWVEAKGRGTKKVGNAQMRNQPVYDLSQFGGGVPPVHAPTGPQSNMMNGISPVSKKPKGKGKGKKNKNGQGFGRRLIERLLQAEAEMAASE